MTATQPQTAEHRDRDEAPLLSLRNVAISYPLGRRRIFNRQRLPVIKDLSFDIYRGDSVGVVGRNGAGKSTLLCALAGAIKPDGGEIVRRAQRCMLLSLKLGFLSYLTMRENIYMGGLFVGLTRKQIEERFDRIVEFSELEYALDRPLGTFSSGMRARVGFAVALEADPDVLLVDEVLGVGDRQFKKKAMKAMKDRLQCHNSTVVFVSHNPKQVRMLCSRAVWIEEGVAQKTGTADEVMDAYENFMDAGE